MPKSTTIDAAIRSIVAEQIAAAMDPYRVVFERLSSFLDGKVPGRGPGRPRKAGAPARRSARASSGDAAKAAKAFKVGDAVVYKQGRGSFDAKVLEIDEATGLVKVERLSDGKKVERPATKLGAGSTGGTEGAEPKPTRQPKARKAGKGPKARKAAKVDFAEGQKVIYKQGRGSFEATVVAIDPETGMVKLEREKDGKKVTRPAAKVSLAA